MAVRDTYVAVADGDQLDDGYFNGAYYGRGKIAQIYTSTGFDTTQSGGAGTNTNSHELNSISSTNLASTDYVEIMVTASHICSAISGNGANTTLKIESKEIGGSYSDSLAQTTIHRADSGGSDSNQSTATFTISWIHTLTAGEKSNGVQFQITSTSTTLGSAASSVTNVQTIVRTVGD